MTLISHTPVKIGRVEKRIRGRKANLLDLIILAFQRDSNFIHQNKAELRVKYPDRWIAVKEGRVVGFNKNPTQLRYKLRQRVVDPRDCVIEFIETRRRTLILIKVA